MKVDGRLTNHLAPELVEALLTPRVGRPAPPGWKSDRSLDGEGLVEDVPEQSRLFGTHDAVSCWQKRVWEGALKTRHGR